MRVRDPRARQRDVGARVGRADRSIVTWVGDRSARRLKEYTAAASMVKDNLETDVLICGAGPTGLMLATAGPSGRPGTHHRRRGRARDDVARAGRLSASPLTSHAAPNGLPSNVRSMRRSETSKTLPS